MKKALIYGGIGVGAFVAGFAVAVFTSLPSKLGLK